MKPMRDLIVMTVNPEPKEKQTESGLFLQAPKWAKPQNIGLCEQVGPDVTTVEVGHYYLINPYSVIDTEDKNIKIIREKDVLCQIESPDR